MRRKQAYILLIAMISVVPLSGASQTRKVIFDTDFVFPPQDDAITLTFVLNCPELEILGITYSLKKGVVAESCGQLGGQ